MKIDVKNPYGFIYITTNLISGMKYIGQKKFTKQWRGYLGSGINLTRAIKRYGRSNFIREIVAIAYSKDELNYLEIEFIKNHNAAKSRDYYNIAQGGKAGNTLEGKTEDEMQLIKKNMSISKQGMYVGEDNPNYGNHLSKEARESISRRQKGNRNFYGKHHTDESKKKLSLALKGKYMGENNWNYRRCRSIEERKNISKNHANMKGENNPMYGKSGELAPSAKKVICTTTNKIFNCMVDAAKYYNIKSSSAITSCCRKRPKYKSAGKTTNEYGHKIKLAWMYYDEYLKLNKKEM